MNTINYKQLVIRYFSYTVIPVIIFVILFTTIFYITDPNQLFHKSWFHEDRLTNNMRVQAAGLINNFEFDSIILGSSMLENTSAKEASDKIGGKFINISAGGCNFFERSFILNKALKKNLKNVIYSLDWYYLACLTERSDEYKTNNWTYLYDNNRFNDFNYYFQKKYIFNFYSPYTLTQKADFDRPNAWYKSIEHSSRFGGLENWIKNIDNNQIHDFLLTELPAKARLTKKLNFDKSLANANLNRAKEYINIYILSFAKKYKLTNFYLLFPPYYRYRYAYWAQYEPDNFYIHQEIIRYLVEQSLTIKNIFIFGFEDEDFLDDISNYKDTFHYHKKFNSYFLDAISDKKHLITNDNLDKYLSVSKKKALKFNIQTFNSKVQSLIKISEKQ